MSRNEARGEAGMRWVGVCSGVAVYAGESGTCSVLAALGAAIWDRVAWFAVSGRGGLVR